MRLDHLLSKRKKKTKLIIESFSLPRSISLPFFIDHCLGGDD